MDGPMAGVVPAAVEQEVGNWVRVLSKLEKGFVQVPTAKKIATRVCAEMPSAHFVGCIQFCSFNNVFLIWEILGSTYQRRVYFDKSRYLCRRR